MLFPRPLRPARLVRRYKRFLADVTLEDGPEVGTEVTVHCPNPGAMLGLNTPDARVWVAPQAPSAKLPFQMQLVEADGVLVGINTLVPNRVVAEALAAKVVPELAAYTEIRPEVAYGQASRVDFRLRREGLPDAYVEVKNCHLSRTPGLAEFPDCKAERSARHMEELAASVRDGHRAVVIITVQRQDCDLFAAAADLDPGFARAFHAAIDAGVEVQPWVCAMTTEGVTLSHRIALS